MPVSALHFRTGRREEAEGLVKTYHYSRRVPANVQMVGSLHLDGGLFGGDGPMVAAAFWTYPPTRWAEQVVELARLVRADVDLPHALHAKYPSAARAWAWQYVFATADYVLCERKCQTPCQRESRRQTPPKGGIV